jgi:hypothetical protein
MRPAGIPAATRVLPSGRDGADDVLVQPFGDEILPDVRHESFFVFAGRDLLQELFFFSFVHSSIFYYAKITKISIFALNR